MPKFGPIKRKDLIYYLKQSGFETVFGWQTPNYGQRGVDYQDSKPSSRGYWQGVIDSYFATGWC